MLPRPKQTNCQNEPAYPENATVVFSIRYPNLTAHRPTARCSIKEPHSYNHCGEWKFEFQYYSGMEAEREEFKITLTRTELTLLQEIFARICAKAADYEVGSDYGPIEVLGLAREGLKQSTALLARSKEGV